jgi:hypothetical protein
MSEDSTAPEGNTGEVTFSRDNSSAAIDVIFSISGTDPSEYEVETGEFCNERPDGTYDLQMGPGQASSNVIIHSTDNPDVETQRILDITLQDSIIAIGDFGVPYLKSVNNLTASIKLNDDDANTQLFGSDGEESPLNQAITAGPAGVFPETFKVKATDVNGDPVAGKLVDLSLGGTPNLNVDHTSALTDAGGFATFHISGKNADTYTISTTTHNPGPVTFDQLLVANPIFQGNSAHTVRGGKLYYSVKVTKADGTTPYAGQNVTWSVDTGSTGKFNFVDEDLTTNGSGFAYCDVEGGTAADVYGDWSGTFSVSGAGPTAFTTIPVHVSDPVITIDDASMAFSETKTFTVLTSNDQGDPVFGVSIDWTTSGYLVSDGGSIMTLGQLDGTAYVAVTAIADPGNHTSGLGYIHLTASDSGVTKDNTVTVG